MAEKLQAYYSIENIYARMQDQTQCKVALIGSKAVGCIGRRGHELVSFYTIQRGVGKLLHADFVQESIAIGHKEILLHANLLSEPIYARWGYETISALEYSVVGIPGRWMRLNL